MLQSSEFWSATLGIVAITSYMLIGFFNNSTRRKPFTLREIVSAHNDAWFGLIVGLWISTAVSMLAQANDQHMPPPMTTNPGLFTLWLLCIGFWLIGLCHALYSWLRLERSHNAEPAQRRPGEQENNHRGDDAIPNIAVEIDDISNGR